MHHVYPKKRQIAIMIRLCRRRREESIIEYAFYHRTLPRLIKFAGLIFNFLTVGSGFLVLQFENNQSLLRTGWSQVLPADTHSYTKNR